MSRKVALTQFLRFATVGAAAVFVDLAIHYTLYYKTTFLATTEMPINRFAALKAISIAVGTMMSYTGNSLWTFREKAKVGIRQFVKYCIVVTSTTSAGVLISNYATHSQTNASEAVWALTSLAVTTFVAIANFIGHKKFTYR